MTPLTRYEPKHTSEAVNMVQQGGSEHDQHASTTTCHDSTHSLWTQAHQGGSEHDQHASTITCHDSTHIL
ncbi:hypothetical protein PISMIDRAFT_13896 [Pisolithus microcarpus 441]|uniref:Uncharacterized protein n=1 Tax=Pisolithus microcarpus 441 TaxID=765257 RepID=A0A0C9Z9J8_9AGAM|nr:hypothetical protein PISMIDRAFT_13896 [Pisolithus microcarpus 441]